MTGEVKGRHHSRGALLKQRGSPGFDSCQRRRWKSNLHVGQRCCVPAPLSHRHRISSVVQAGVQVLHLFSSSLSKPEKHSCAADDEGLQLLIGILRARHHTHTHTHTPSPVTLHIEKPIQSTIWWLFPALMVVANVILIKSN